MLYKIKSENKELNGLVITPGKGQLIIKQGDYLGFSGRFSNYKVKYIIHQIDKSGFYMETEVSIDR